MNILVSVVIPVYNVENYVEQCVQSILKQTVTNIEIVLVNDGSNDNSGDVCERLASLDHRISVIHKKNEGPSSARNVGIKVAKGEYISFVDSDDWIEPDFLESLYFMASNNNADIVNTGLTVNFIAENREQKINYPKELCLIDSNKFGIFFWELHKLKLSNYPVTRLFKRELLLHNNIFFNTDVHVGEDLIFNLEAFKSAKCICINTMSSYHYMKRELGTQTSIYNPNFIKASEIQIEAYTAFFEHFSMKDREYNEFLDRFSLNMSMGYILNLHKKNSPFTTKERISLIDSEIFKNRNLINPKLKRIKMTRFNDRLSKFLILNTNAFATETIFKLLFLLRNKFETVYLKVRFTLNN